MPDVTLQLRNSKKTQLNPERTVQLIVPTQSTLWTSTSIPAHQSTAQNVAVQSSNNCKYISDNYYKIKYNCPGGFNHTHSTSESTVQVGMVY